MNVLYSNHFNTILCEDITQMNDDSFIKIIPTSDPYPTGQKSSPINYSKNTFKSDRHSINIRNRTGYQFGYQLLFQNKMNFFFVTEESSRSLPLIDVCTCVYAQLQISLDFRLSTILACLR